MVEKVLESCKYKRQNGSIAFTVEKKEKEKKKKRKRKRKKKKTKNTKNTKKKGLMQ